MTDDYEGSRTEFMKMLAEHDSPPAFVIRAERVKSVWTNLLTDCQKQQAELTDMPRTRLAQLAHLIDHNWPMLSAHMPTEHGEFLESLYKEWQPELRGELLPTTSQGKIRKAVEELKVSFERFNRRWLECVSKVNLERVNYEREQYNDYYLVEKSAALGSDKLAEMGFERLQLRTQDDILEVLPLLLVPNS